MSDGHQHDREDDHEHGHEHDDEAEAHDDHGFDGEPARELGPDEPQTPMWLPAVGAAIFVVGAILFLTRGDATAATSDAGSKPAAAARTAAAMTVAAPVPPRPVAPVTAGAAPGTPPARKLTPDQLKDLQKRIEEAKARKQGANGAK